MAYWHTTGHASLTVPRILNGNASDRQGRLRIPPVGRSDPDADVPQVRDRRSPVSDRCQLQPPNTRRRVTRRTRAALCSSVPSLDPRASACAPRRQDASRTFRPGERQCVLRSGKSICAPVICPWLSDHTPEQRQQDSTSSLSPTELHADHRKRRRRTPTGRRLKSLSPGSDRPS